MEELEGFFISEMDLFCFCIAVVVALFLEVSELKKIPFDIRDVTFYGILMFYISIIGYFMGLSLEFEHRLIILRQEKMSLLMIGKGITENEIQMGVIELKKLKLFFISILFSVTTALGSYRTLFQEENE